MSTRSLTGVLLSVLMAALPGQSPSGARQINWEKSFDAALAKAGESRTPLFVAFILKGEAANEEICRNHFHSPEIVEQSRKFVCIPACLEPHQPDANAPCPAFPGITCNDHVRIESQARQALLDSPRVDCPLFLFLKPDDRSVVLRHVWMLPARELLLKMQIAHGLADPATASKRQPADEVAALMKDAACDHQARRRSALATLAKVDDPRITEFLIKQTGPAAGAAKRIEAIYAMREKGGARFLACLHDLLKSPDSRIRMYAAISLGGIGAKESAPDLAAAVRKENKDRVRVHIVRALFACGDDQALLRDAVLALLQSTSQLDLVTALYHARFLQRTPEIDKALVRSVTSNNSQVREAAYYALGALRVEKAEEVIARRVGSEKPPVRSAAEWALAQIQGRDSGDHVDPGTEILAMLPDAAIYEGDMDGGKSRSRH